MKNALGGFAVCIFQIAVLVTDVGKNAIRFHDLIEFSPLIRDLTAFPTLNLIAFPALKGYDRLISVGVGAGNDFRPAVGSLAVEIPQSRSALLLAAAGDKEDRNVCLGR